MAFYDQRRFANTEVGGTDSGSDGSDGFGPRSWGGNAARRCALRGACAVGLLGFLVLAVTLGLAIRGRQLGAPTTGDPALSQNLHEAKAFSDLQRAAEPAAEHEEVPSTTPPRSMVSLPSKMDLPMRMNEAAHRFQGLAKEMEGKIEKKVEGRIEEKFTHKVDAAPVATAVATTGSDGSLASDDSEDDGKDICADDEELHVKLCYKKCSLLTGGSYPIRSSAWTCCRAHPCGFFNSRMTSPLKICHGFDVSGDGEGTGCPHAPGLCHANEEFSLGMCYRKCSDLTNGEYPHRVAAGTCCKVFSKLGCLWIMNVKTRMSFAVGGGTEGDDKAPHGPKKHVAGETHFFA